MILFIKLMLNNFVSELLNQEKKVYPNKEKEKKHSATIKNQRFEKNTNGISSDINACIEQNPSTTLKRCRKYKNLLAKNHLKLLFFLFRDCVLKRWAKIRCILVVKFVLLLIRFNILLLMCCLHNSTELL